MTVQEAGVPGPPLRDWPPSVQFDLWPRRIGLDPGVSDEPPPNPNCFDALQRWPGVVEIRRPDGSRVSAELRLGRLHLNFAYEIRNKRDAAGRVRSPWQQVAALKGLSAADVPPGSEVWGEVSDEDFR
jgi:hypothetical protein